MPGLANQSVGEFGVNAPVAQFVGVGQHGAGHDFADPHVVKLGSLRRQARLDIVGAFAIGQLGERRNAEVLDASQRPDATIAPMPSHDPVKGFPWQKVHDLGEQSLAKVHRKPWLRESC